MCWPAITMQAQDAKISLAYSPVAPTLILATMMRMPVVMMDRVSIPAAPMPHRATTMLQQVAMTVHAYTVDA